MEHKTIFSKKYLRQRIKNSHLKALKNEATSLSSLGAATPRQEKMAKIKSWQESILSEKIIHQKEEELQTLFLQTFFGEILEYDYTNPNNWNLGIETNTGFDATKADGSLGFFSIDKENKTKINTDIRAVIELKNARTPLDKAQNRKDFKGSPVEQAFRYAQKVGEKCNWIIVSNFLEIRLYRANDINKYESFDILDLNKNEEFDRFYYLLSQGQLFLKKTKSEIELLIEKRIEEEEKIEKEFYAEYKTYREFFVEHLITYNKKIPPLNLLQYAQTIIDRLVFISIVKDFDLVPLNILSKLQDISTAAWTDDKMELWRQVKNLFNAMNNGMPPRLQKFNGGLFKQNPEIDNLKIRDFFLSKLFNLSRYDFESDLSINILGHIFEQSISDIEELKERITSKNFRQHSEENDIEIDKSLLEEKNQRKKHGIFYTPEYITNYIVKTTIENWLENKKDEIGLNQIDESDKTQESIENQLKLWDKYKDILSEITVLDPACGSGAFITQAFDFLYKEWKTLIDIVNKLRLNFPKKKRGKLFKDNDLNEIKIKKHIISKNLFGVDLNYESVEITKLGLWLKTATKNDSLANLDENIKCGNSLIDTKKIAGEKAFKWKNEFPKIMENGGFDIIVGNPPYGVNFNEKEKEALEKFDELVPDYEIYIYFISLATNKLLNKNGYLAYIFPNTFLSTLYGKKYRERIIENYTINEIVDLSNDETFEDASVRTCVFNIQNKKTDNYKIDFKTLIVNKEKERFFKSINTYSNQFLKEKTENWLSISSLKEFENDIIEKVQKNNILKDFFDVSQGLIPYDKYRGHTEYQIKNRVYHSDKKEDKTYRKELKGGDVNRYNLNWNGQLWISYGDWLAAPRKNSFFTKERILIREITADLLFCTYTDEEFYNTPSLINIIQSKEILDLKYLLSILNSKLIGWYHNSISPKAKKGLFPKILINDVRNLPIKEATKEEQTPFIEKANLMLSLNKELQEKSEKFIKRIKSNIEIEKISNKLQTFYKHDFKDFVSELKKQKIKLTLKEQDKWEDYFDDYKSEINNIEQKIQQTDQEINQMIYKLYNLTEEEIKIIEN